MIGAETRGAWRSLETQLRPFVARRVRRPADVDDVVQDIFLRMQRGLPGLRDGERFGPWVYQLARSAVAEHRRQASRHPLSGSEPPDVAAEWDDEVAGVEQEVASFLAPFVAALRSPYREALTLTELEGLTQKEAAELSGVSLSAMKSRVQRGRLELRALLEACCHIALDARGRMLSCEPRPDGKFPDGCCG